MSQKTIITLTMNPSIDIDTSTAQVLPDRKLRCTEPRWDPGGGGLNVARALRILGGDATALFPCGGHTGQLLCDLLDQAEVSYRPIPVAAMVRESFTVGETDTGHQFRFNLPGPQMAEAEWQACFEAVRTFSPRPDFVVLSGSLPPGAPVDLYGRLVREFAGTGTRVIVDSSGEAQLEALVMGGIFLIKPNPLELDELAGRTLQIDAERVDFARSLVARKQVDIVAVSMGPAGTIYVSADSALHLYPPKVPVVSRVGAGDSMIAAITLALARGWSRPEAFLYGIAASSSAVMTPGTALCTREDTDRLYQELLETQGTPTRTAP